MPPLSPDHPFRGSTAVTAGHVTRGRLRGAGWKRLLTDVYVHRDVVVDHRIWCEAVALILPPGTAIGGLSAAHLWGAGLPGAEAQVTVAASRGRWSHRHPRIRTHYTTLVPGDLTATDGLSVTTPERTAFDLGRRLRRADALVALDALPADLGAVAEMARQRHRWPGIPQLNALLRLADPRSESPMETRLRLLFHDAGLPAPRPQYEVRDEHGRLIGRVDLGWPTARLAAEYEGDHHREREQFRRDIGRVNALRRAGWTVLRFTADDVFSRPAVTARFVAAELSRLR